MNRFMALIVAFLVLSLSSTAVFSAGPSAPGAPAFRPYVSVFGGASLGASVNTIWSNRAETEKFNLNTGWSIGGAAGVKWNDLLRAEIEISHSQWSGKDVVVQDAAYPAYNYAATGTVAETYLLGNVWVDLKTNTVFTPYVGGGVGVAFVKTAGVQWNNSPWGYVDAAQTNLAWQLGAGVKYDISEQLSLGVDYRFKNVEGLQFVNGNGNGSFINGRLSSHNIEVGLTYNF